MIQRRTSNKTKNHKQEGNAPIPLQNNQQNKNEDDILDDYLRDQKRMEKVNKLQQMEDQLVDQQIQAEKKYYLDKYLRQNKDAKLAYDFDGNFVVQNTKKQRKHEQTSQEDNLNLKVNYNVSKKEQVTKNNHIKKSQPEKVQVLKLINNNQSNEYSDIKKQNIQQSEMDDNRNTFQNIMNNIQLQKGVKIIGGQESNQYAQQFSQQKTNDQTMNCNQDVKKMTKKEYDQMIKNGTNFIRNDYRFQQNQFSTNQKPSTGQQYSLNNNDKNQINKQQSIRNINQGSVFKEQAQNSINKTTLNNINKNIQLNNSELKQQTINSIDINMDDINNQNSFQNQYQNKVKLQMQNRKQFKGQTQQNVHGSIKVVDQHKLNLLLG